ncbi:hypothetical protein [Pedobacter nototheniae]|uniref:hypothetical protein n=1 Tax=Pedobacter nototheniae TaxID=2488994 RepID=UPI00292D032E|nr:hypothetical protein [Pedobacter nototheniae]
MIQPLAAGASLLWATKEAKLPARNLSVKVTTKARPVPTETLTMPVKSLTDKYWLGLAGRKLQLQNHTHYLLLKGLYRLKT